MIKAIVNGKEWELPGSVNINDLLSKFKISPKICVVEKNGEIVNRREYEKTIIRDHDRLEIIRMLAGG